MKKYILLPLVGLLLSGCSFTSSSNSSSSSSSISNSSVSSSTNSTTTIIQSTNEYGETLLDGYYKATTQTLDLHELRKTYVFNDLPSVGDVNILVVPVRFQDSTHVEDKYCTYEEMKENIEVAFFGEDYETGWESVSSFYKKSSYNKLNIQGEVTDWFTTDKTFDELTRLTVNEYTDPTIYILRQVDDWYKENYGETTEFDKDKDGYIDAIWMVYDAPYLNQNRIDWAYTTWDFMNHELPYVESPIAYTYAWASVDFMYDGNYKDENNNTLVDAHTLIHETGHLLGLEDYYDYDGKETPLGSLDMMDTNIGDHNGYSKYSLGWTNPYVVTDECEVEIKPFQENGDIILVKNDWNKSSMDEYLLIEFYTPTGLNALDAQDLKENKYKTLYQENGIKIYHVDARLGYYTNERFSEYTDELYGINTNYKYSTKLAHSNTGGKSADKNFKLIKLLEIFTLKYWKGIIYIILLKNRI
jgi:M6 family metalloprotease-like protein